MSTGRNDHKNLPCHGFHHFFDREDVCDRYRDHNSKNSTWLRCEESPCPNRNTTVAGIDFTSNWHEEIDLSQIQLIVKHNQAQAQPQIIVSKIFKTLFNISELKSDGSNYVIWSSQVTMMAKGCSIGDFLKNTALARKKKE